jgi:hypothetical protein
VAISALELALEEEGAKSAHAAVRTDNGDIGKTDELERSLEDIERMMSSPRWLRTRQSCIVWARSTRK